MAIESATIIDAPAASAGQAGHVDDRRVAAVPANGRQVANGSRSSANGRIGLRQHTGKSYRP